MSSEVLHVPRESLSRETLELHYAITSLMEELEAIDWYRQRADDTKDPELKEVLLHNAREETEHAAMVLEWIRRKDATFDKELREYLFQKGSITGREEELEGKEGE
jgi:ferritin-like protein